MAPEAGRPDPGADDRPSDRQAGAAAISSRPTRDPHHEELVPEDHVVVLWGATGDLAKRKLLPGLYRLAAAGLLPPEYRIIATSPDELTDQAFAEHARESIERFGELELTDEGWTSFAAHLSYVVSGPDRMDDLTAAVAAERADLSDARLLHYLAIPPAAFPSVVTALRDSGLADPPAKVIIEKPFGSDLDSARTLNALLRTAFDEDDVFLIDHFLGKEDVQNILVSRFANGLLEPTWNSQYVDSVQIDVPETLGIEGRGPFYEGVGAFRDMVVTHLMQTLGFVAMERPDSFTAGALAAAKQAVFADLQPVDPSTVVRGQYEGYLQEPGVAADSDTETFVALEMRIDNDRWAGVPFLLRTGKRLAQRRSTVTLYFRRPAHALFPGDHHPGSLTFEIGEPGGIELQFLAKVPGARTALGPARLTFNYETSFNVEHQLTGYERLLHDAMLGDRTLFNRAAAIERLWEIAAPLLADPPPLRPYAPESWGPGEAFALLGPRRWHLPD